MLNNCCISGITTYNQFNMSPVPDFPPYTNSIHHDGSRRYVQVSGNQEPSFGDEVILRVRAAKEVPLERILLRTFPDGEQHFTELSRIEDGPACQWWQVPLRLTMPLNHYRFLLFTSDGAWWYNASGLHLSMPTDAEDFRILAGYRPPGWVRSSVFYQIFPDRFADGDASNNVRDGEYTYWGEPSRFQSWGEPPASGRPAMVEFYGGDLAGIENRLDYLEELGINAIYLNPIFTALSNHRYDVIDYTSVDPHLGGNEALISFRRATQQRSLRFILDIVPNHCGYFHPWFQAALSDTKAPTADFFTFHSHPNEYECWLGVKSLPKFNYQNQTLRNIMYAGPNSIFKIWLRQPYSIDGWRLDVANMLGRQGPAQLGKEVGVGIRNAIRDVNPEAYILGENFFDAAPQLQGDSLDAAMNYSGFAKPLWFWLSGFQVRQHAQPSHVVSTVPWSTRALVDTWKNFRASIPWEIARQQYNLLGSHDTERILSLVGGSGSLNRLAAGLLMTYLGVPGVYYGDEVGMGTGKHTAARATMSWDRAGWDEDLLAYHKQLIWLRRNSPALIEGGFQVMLVEENTLVYLRDTDNEQIIVVAHRGPGQRSAQPLPVAHGAVPNGKSFTELTTGRKVQVEGGPASCGCLIPRD
jgi:alpha-glucosidase